MQISSRFTVALHIFACVETFKDDYKVTSDFLVSSINTNPVIIRKILSQLKNAGSSKKRSMNQESEAFVRSPFYKRKEHCLHCGNCLEACPAGAEERR